jgi:murein DD-endopeptidase MepM/ murein hydrolase activator NlpD
MSECRICGRRAYERDQRVLVSGRARTVLCSDKCLGVVMRQLRKARIKAWLRGVAWAVVVVAALAGAGYMRFVLQARRPKSAPAPAVAETKAPPEPPAFGPSWPPTDEDWLYEFERIAWVYPLPGPGRRAPVGCRKLFADAPSRCRGENHCGVDLGGELWGEHVFAAAEGVIDRVQRNGDGRGGISVRLAHAGGSVFTQYFHLAAIPTRISRGMPVGAGDIIGLLGDTGTERARLHFTLSTRPSPKHEETYWDAEPLMKLWPVRTPERGSVAGLVSMDAPADHVLGTPLARGH